MISTALPFVLRLSKDERRVFQQNHISITLRFIWYAIEPAGVDATTACGKAWVSSHFAAIARRSTK